MNRVRIAGHGLLGDPTCCAKHCNAPAAVHIWLFDERCTIAVCERHFKHDVCKRLAPGHHDRHPFGGVCNMPGVKWQRSTPEAEGFCFYPLTEDVETGAETTVERELQAVS